MLPTTIRYHLIEVNPAASGIVPAGMRQRKTIARTYQQKDGTQVAEVHFDTERDIELARLFARDHSQAKNQFGLEELVGGKWVRVKATIKVMAVEYVGREPQGEGTVVDI